jgi:hypothetical protein
MDCRSCFSGSCSDSSELDDDAEPCALVLRKPAEVPTVVACDVPDSCVRVKDCAHFLVSLSNVVASHIERKAVFFRPRPSDKYNIGRFIH